MTDNNVTRRDFIKTASTASMATLVAAVAGSGGRCAAGSDVIRVGVIGCGGRGTGAVANAMSAGGLVLGDNTGRQMEAGKEAGGPVKLVAMADIRQDRLDEKYAVLRQQLGERHDYRHGQPGAESHGQRRTDRYPVRVCPRGERAADAGLHRAGDEKRSAVYVPAR